MRRAVREYYRNTMDVIRASLESIDEAVYNELVSECEKVIRSGGKIIASGLGKNVPICEKFVGTLNSLGIDARFMHTNTAIHGDLGMVGKKDLVLLLSKGGNTPETVQLAQYLRERGTDTWLLTFSGSSKSGEYIDKSLILDLENEGDKWNIVPNNSTTVYLILLQGIAIELADRLEITLEDFGINHPGGGIGAKLRGEQIWK